MNSTIHQLAAQAIGEHWTADEWFTIEEWLYETCSLNELTSLAALSDGYVLRDDKASQLAVLAELTPTRLVELWDELQTQKEKRGRR
jgi:hypothetical protein